MCIGGYSSMKYYVLPVFALLNNSFVLHGLVLIYVHDVQLLKAQHKNKYVLYINA